MITSKAEFKKRFEKIETLGEGSYGKVYKVKDNQFGRIMALKKVKFGSEEEGIPATTIREIALLRELRHENIVPLRDIIYYPMEKKCYIVFDYFEMDLRKFIDKNTITLDQIKHIFFQIVKGVDHLHQNGIFHRDLKPQNILIDPKTLTIKIADFGLARHFSIPFGVYSKEIVTLWYRAPEILMAEKKYGIGVDLWSLGCIFFDLFMKKPLFKGESQIDNLYLIFQFLGTPNESTWPGINDVPDWSNKFPKLRGHGFSKFVGIHLWDQVSVDLLTKMLQLDPVKRITCPEILNHKFFAR